MAFGQVLALLRLQAPCAWYKPEIGHSRMDTERDPMTIARLLLEAENAHDVQAVVDLFSDHPLVKPAMYTYTSRAEVRAWQEELVANNLAITAGEFKINGNRVYWDGQIAMDRLRNLGFETLDGSWEIVVEAGKIAAFTFAYSPESIARLSLSQASGNSDVADR